MHSRATGTAGIKAHSHNFADKRFTQDVPGILARTKKDKRLSTGAIHKTYRTLFETQNLTTPKSCLSHFSNSGLYSTLDFFSDRACS